MLLRVSVILAGDERKERAPELVGASNQSDLRKEFPNFMFCSIVVIVAGKAKRSLAKEKRSGGQEIERSELAHPCDLRKAFQGC